MAEPTSNPTPPTAATPPAPPPPPRAVTPAVARRAWAEPNVRFWWLGGAVIGLIFLYFCGAQVYAWNKTRKLISEGKIVDAKVTEANGYVLEVQKAPKDSPVKLEYEYNGRTYPVEGFLEGRQDPIVPQSTVQVRIDPDNPRAWTYRTETPPLGSQLIAPLVLLPMSAIVLAVAAVARRNVLRTWQLAPAKLAIVVDTGQRAIAPGSRALRCTIPEHQDKKLHTVFVPTKIKLAKGDVLYLLPPHKNKGPALAAAAFE